MAGLVGCTGKLSIQSCLSKPRRSVDQRAILSFRPICAGIRAGTVTHNAKAKAIVLIVHMNPDPGGVWFDEYQYFVTTGWPYNVKMRCTVYGVNPEHNTDLYTSL